MWETFLQLIAMTIEHPTRGFTSFWQPFEKFCVKGSVQLVVQHDGNTAEGKLD